MDNNELPKVDGYQEISSSTYFSPSWYIYLQDAVNNNSKVYVSPKTDVSNADLFSFLTHVGPLSAAVEAKVIRESKTEKLSYSGKLVRLGGRDIVVQVTI